MDLNRRLLALSSCVLLACGGSATPQEPAAAPLAHPAAPVPSGPPAPPGTRAHACPDIDKPQPRQDGPCTEMHCTEGFSIALYPNAAWPSGSYRFVIARDGETTTCEGTLPLPPCERAGVSCDDDGARVGASGCALPPGQHAFGDIGIAGYPKVVEVDVLRDGVQLTRARYDVAYSTVYPNGPECGSPCCSARSGALTLPKPK